MSHLGSWKWRHLGRQRSRGEEGGEPEVVEAVETGKVMDVLVEVVVMMLLGTLKTRGSDQGVIHEGDDGRSLRNLAEALVEASLLE